MASIAEWIEGARPRTLPAAIAPVIAGAGVTGYTGTTLSTGEIVRNGLLALLVALALQIGVNYFNDYSDGVRGTDEVRVGPVRLVGQGLAPAKQVRTAALVSLAVAAIAGLALILLIADQFTKVLIVGHYQLGDSTRVTSFFNIVRVHNTGAAFSFLASAGGWQRWFFTALGLAAAGFILWMLRAHSSRQHSHRRSK